MGETEATRVSYGKALAALGGQDDRIVVLDADLSHATMTKTFADQYPQRFFNMGIAECNMVCVAAGMAATGLIPFCSTFAMFGAGRAFEMIRNAVAYPQLNVKFGFSHAGVSIGEDGGSHQAIEDMALMRAIPGMTILAPCDARETRAAVQAAAEMQGPVYIRLSRFPSRIYDKAPFAPGKARVMARGNDLALFACGPMVDVAMDCREALLAEGITLAVISASSIKPFDRETAREQAARCGAVASLEDHSVIGGLGDALADALRGAYSGPMEKIGIEDCFGQSGKSAVLLDAYGLSVRRILPRLRQLIKSK